MTKWSLMTLCLAALSCGGPEEPEPVLDALPVPPLPKGAFEYRFPESVIPALSERQFCHFMESLPEDVYYSELRSYQGKNGHHLLLFRALSPEPAGTMRDCTDAVAMATLLPVLIETNRGLNGFPDGMALRVPKGTQLVWQQHYLNTGAEPLLTRDVAHITQVEKAKVRDTVGFWAVSDSSYEISPGKTKMTMKCVAQYEMKVLVALPHMHEWGTRFEGFINNQKVVDVQHWEADFRDNPPSTLFTEFSPLVIKKGDVFRHDCYYDNDTGAPLRFPKEMCAFSGFFFPANEDFICTSPGAISPLQ